MTLTARQNTFYERITRLLELSSSVNVLERDYLTAAYDGLKSGDDFKKVINNLNLRYKELESWQPGGLTQESRKLRDDLVEIYGEPQGTINNWAESDPDYIFAGKVWIKRGENPYKPVRFSDGLNFMAWLVISILVLFAILFLLYELKI
ncbi:hypothetical protein [Lactovum odontotermitis]